MRAKILVLGFMIWLIGSFGISILYSTELPKVEWEYIKGGQGIAIVQDATFDEVWENVLDVLLFEKFKMRGQPIKVRHKTVTIEKDAGLIVVNGWIGSTFSYVLNVTVREKDNHIEVKCRCSSSWKKKAIEKFFQLLEKEVKK